VPYLDRLHFAGGEPLIIPQSFDFLRKIIELGFAKNITLTYNTNLTVIPPQAYEIWPHFKGVFLTISLDGYDAVNHYIRYPARWADLEKNMKTIETEHEKLNVTSASIHATIQVYNVLRLTEMFNYLEKNYRFINPYPAIDMVMGKSFLDIQILPRLLKWQASWQLVKHMARLKKNNDPRAKEFIGRIQSIVTYMNEAHHTEMIAEFKRVTEIYDRRRSEKLDAVIPELSPLMLSPVARFFGQLKGLLRSAPAHVS
jgi:sulfatase maturation enzyme AslB (radical SAM superfamily)